MARGITITNYLVNGDPEGIILAYLSNWSGQAIKIPRNLFADAKRMPEINRPGVYFLFGKNTENQDEKLVYVGEGNNLSSRIVQHMNDEGKDFCEVIVCFSSKDENLPISHPEYLEHKIISQISESSEYQPINRKEGNSITVAHMVKDEMETFYDNMKIILPTIGFNVLQENRKALPLVNHTVNSSSIISSNTISEDILYLDIKNIVGLNIKASARLTSNGLEVLAGSSLNQDIQSYTSGSYNALRQTLLKKEVIISNPDGLKFVKDYEFSSPSAAAATIMGYSINGRKVWKNKEGKSINDIEAALLKVLDNSDRP